MITEIILPLGLGAVLTMVLGVVWYGPLFGKEWGSDIFGRKSKSEVEMMKQAMAKKYGMMFLGNILTGYVLFVMLKWLQFTTVDKAMELSFLSWAGFVAPVSIANNLFSNNKKWGTVAIEVMYVLSYMLVMAVCIVVMRK